MNTTTLILLAMHAAASTMGGAGELNGQASALVLLGTLLGVGVLGYLAVRRVSSPHRISMLGGRLPRLRRRFRGPGERRI